MMQRITSDKLSWALANPERITPAGVTQLVLDLEDTRKRVEELVRALEELERRVRANERPDTVALEIVWAALGKAGKPRERAAVRP